MITLIRNHIRTLAAAVALLSLAACDDSVPCPPAQGEPQGPVFRTGDLTVSAPVDADTGSPVAIDLRNGAETVTVGVYTLDNWNPRYELTMTMYVASEAGAATEASLPVTAQPDGTVTASSALLGRAFVEAVSKSPNTRTVYVSFAARADRDGESGYILGGRDHRYGNYTLTVTPAAPSYTIEEHYYMLSPATGWTATPLELTHSEENPYDDPVFSATVNISATEATAGFGWVIVAESQLPRLDSGDFSAFTGDALAGTLTPITGTDGAGVVGISGPVKFDFNMETMRYDIYVAYDFLYTPGVANDWTQADSERLATRDFITYSGFANLEFAFRLSATTDWTTAWGYDESTGRLEAGSIDNIRVTRNGLNYVAVNLDELTYSLSPVTGISIAGTAVSGGSGRLAADRSDPLTARGTGTFTGTGTWRVTFDTDGTTPIPALGGTPDCLVTDSEAPSLPAPEGGTYTVTLDLSTIPYTINLTPQQ